MRDLGVAPFYAALFQKTLGPKLLRKETTINAKKKKTRMNKPTPPPPPAPHQASLAKKILTKPITRNSKLKPKTLLRTGARSAPSSRSCTAKRSRSAGSRGSASGAFGFYVQWFHGASLGICRVPFGFTRFLSRAPCLKSTVRMLLFTGCLLRV